MADLEIITITGLNGSPQDLARKILNELRRRKIYRSDLMYRGCAVKARGVELIKKYGTDRSPETELESKRDGHWALRGLDQGAVEEADLREARQSWQEESSPDIIWALPGQGLEVCIEKYADPCPDLPIPMILAYRPENMISYLPGYKHHGTPVLDLPVKERMNEEYAQYKFKEGTSAREEIVAAFRLTI